MKKMIVVAAVLVLTVVAFRRFGPTLGKRAMARCQEMMAGHLGDVGAELSGSCVASKDEPETLVVAPGER